MKHDKHVISTDLHLVHRYYCMCSIGDIFRLYDNKLQPIVQCVNIDTQVLSAP